MIEAKSIALGRARHRVENAALDLDHEFIIAIPEQAGGLHPARAKGVGMRTNLHAVEVNVGRQIQRFKKQPRTIAFAQIGQLECATVKPNRFLHPSAGEHIRANARIGDHAVLQQRLMHAARHGGAPSAAPIHIASEHPISSLAAFAVVPSKLPSAIEVDCLIHD